MAIKVATAYPSPTKRNTVLFSIDIPDLGVDNKHSLDKIIKNPHLSTPREDIMKHTSSYFLSLFIAMTICLLPASGICDMQSLDEAEMHDIYAEGFSEFTLNVDPVTDDATMRLWLNINTAQYTTIDTLKLGWHEGYNYKDPLPSFGWDHDWQNVSIGSSVASADNFKTEGFYFRAEFEDFNDDVNRRLKSITYGFDYAGGDITADFVSYTGTIDDGDGTPEYNGHRLALGEGTITADWDGNRGGLELSLSIDNPYYGYWMTFENARFTPAP
jgi:hypothetical protein